MSNQKPTYEDLEKRLAELDALVEALRNHEIDTIIGEENMAVVRLREVEEQLVEAIKTAERRANDLEAFSYSVSHEFRNPLNNILAMTSVLDKHYANVLDGIGKRCIVEVKKSIVRMSALITQLLLLSKVADHSLEITDVRMDAIAADFLTELRTSDPQRKMRMLINENITVRADKSLMRIAFENLIKNAWKYSSKSENTFIEIGVKNCSEQRHFFVKDNGTGFDMKDAQRIFEPFQRAHPDKDYMGAGIGLSIVKRIIEKHGGRIWAESEIGKGACFYFTLPLLNII